jgi:anti-sigma regulatory factor (Ser/Thr protein kinase)
VLNPGSTYTEEFPATPESVPKARAAVAGFALAAGATGDQLNDVRLAASEGVTNAVLHAYSGPPGAFHVTASYAPGELWLLISDDGAGLRPGCMRGGLGLGLAVIAQVSDEFQIVRRASGGTQLEMRFRLRIPGRPPRPGSLQPRTVTLSPS